MVATYGRPEVLAATLRALTLQHRPEWEAIVVGDCCDERTEAVVRALDDPRVRYYNLPRRFGEQGGPNSVGLSVARGDLITFLNHDDLLLPDHLDVVLAEFADGTIDVLVTRAVKVRWFEAPGDGPPKIICGAHVPATTRISDVIGQRMHDLEPSSAWTVSRPAAERVGPWRSSQTLRRLPLQDWLLRLSVVTRRWRFTDRMTGVSLLGRYRSEAPEALALVDMISSRSPDEIRSVFVPNDDPDEDGPVPSSWTLRALHRLDAAVAPLGLVLHRFTGVDYGPLPDRLRRRDRGRTARELLASRTGEAMPDHSVLPEYLADPEVLRVC